MLARYESTKQVQGGSLVAALLTRKGAWWSLSCPAAPGGPSNTLTKLLQQNAMLVQGLVAASPSHAPIFRHVKIVVNGASGLMATDVHMFSKNSADPYFKFQFRKCRYKSEWKKKTLHPRWAPRELGLGYICASDVKPVKIKLWDYDKYTEPVNFLQNTILDRTHCIAQLRLGSSFLLSVLRFLDGVGLVLPLPGSLARGI